MKPLKEITVMGKTYQYEVYIRIGEYSDIIKTHFYDGVEIVRYRKYCFFGPILKKAEPKYIFSVNYNIEDKNVTREELREKLTSAFKHYIGLINRVEEIKNGELI